MSRFDDLMQDLGRPLIREHLGRTVALYTATGGPANVTAVAVGAVRGEEVETEEGREARRRRTLTLDPEDFGGIGELTLTALNRAVIDGEEWFVRQPPLSLTANLVMFELEGTGALEVSRQGLRR